MTHGHGNPLACAGSTYHATEEWTLSVKTPHGQPRPFSMQWRGWRAGQDVRKVCHGLHQDPRGESVATTCPLSIPEHPHSKLTDILGGLSSPEITNVKKWLSNPTNIAVGCACVLTARCFQDPEVNAKLSGPPHRRSFVVAIAIRGS
jgi:hypothetical protein